MVLFSACSSNSKKNNEYLHIVSESMGGINDEETNKYYNKIVKNVSKEIIIEDDVFIGMHSLILKGAQIGKGSVIGAGSIVTGKIPANVIAAGQPAKVIKELKV